MSHPSFHDRLEEIWREAARSGTPLPNEEALSTQLGVSRPRLREAMAQLEEAGILIRSQGAATIANPAALELDYRLERRKPFNAVLADAGYRAERQVLGSKIIKLNADDAQALQRPLGTPAVWVAKRWLANGAPARLVIDLVPLPTSSLEPHWDVSLPVQELAGLVSGEAVAWEVAVPVAARASRRVGEWLGIARGDAVVCLDCVGVSRSGRRVYRVADYYTGIIRMGLISTVAPTSRDRKVVSPAAGDRPGREADPGTASGI